MADDVEIILRAAGIEELDLAKAKIRELSDETDNFKNKGEGASKSTDRMSKELFTFRTRAIASRLGITALTFALIQYLKESEKTARESDLLNVKLRDQINLINENTKAWDNFKIKVGETIVNVRAAGIETQILSDGIKKATIELGLQNKAYLDLTETQKEAINTSAEEYLILVKNGNELTRQNNELTKLLELSRKLKDESKNKIKNMEDELELQESMNRLNSDQAKDMEEINKIIERENHLTEAEKDAKEKILEIHKSELELLKLQIQNRSELSSLYDEQTKKLQELGKQINEDGVQTEDEIEIYEQQKGNYVNELEMLEKIQEAREIEVKDKIKTAEDDLKEIKNIGDLIIKYQELKKAKEEAAKAGSDNTPVGGQGGRPANKSTKGSKTSG